MNIGTGADMAPGVREALAAMAARGAAERERERRIELARQEAEERAWRAEQRRMTAEKKAARAAEEAERRARRAARKDPHLPGRNDGSWDAWDEDVAITAAALWYGPSRSLDRPRNYSILTGCAMRRLGLQADIPEGWQSRRKTKNRVPPAYYHFERVCCRVVKHPDEYRLAGQELWREWAAERQRRNEEYQRQLERDAPRPIYWEDWRDKASDGYFKWDP